MVLNVWIGPIETSMDVDKIDCLKTLFSAAVGWYLLPAIDREPQAGQNAVQIFKRFRLGTLSYCIGTTRGKCMHVSTGYSYARPYQASVALNIYWARLKTSCRHEKSWSPQSNLLRLSIS